VSDNPTDDGRIDISGFKLVALAAMMLLTFAAAMGMPFNITGIVESFAVSNTNAGLVASFEMGGVAAGSLLFSQIAPRLNPHRVYFTAIGAIVLLNIATIWSPSIELLYACRALTGACAGAIVATVMSTAGRAQAPEATFGIINSAVGVMGILLAIILPQALKLHQTDLVAGMSSVDGLYAVYLLLAVVAIAFVRSVPVPPKIENRTEAKGPEPALPAMGWMALIGLGVIFFGHGTLTMFLVNVGIEQMKLSAETVGFVFMLGGIFGIAAPLAAGYVGTHYKAMVPTGLILTAVVFFALLLANATAPLAFFVAGPVFAMLPVAMMPIVLGALARIDLSGRLTGAHPAFVTLGAAFAPLVGGAISSTGDYAANGWSVVLCSVVGGALLFNAIRAADNVRDGLPVAANPVPASGG